MSSKWIRGLVPKALRGLWLGSVSHAYYPEWKSAFIFPIETQFSLSASENYYTGTKQQLASRSTEFFRLLRGEKR